MIRLPTSIDWLRSVRVFALSFACVTTFASIHAFAEPTPAERGLASALFEQGRTLMGDGRIDEACVKFAESQRMHPGGGTLLNLALCHEKQGKIATALTEFREARTLAKKDNRADRESAAEGEIAKLEPLLSKISVIVSADVKVPGITVEVDGLPLSEGAWGTQFPVDPGTINIIVKAPGYREWKSAIDIGATARTADINVPKLEKDVAIGASTPPVPTTTSSAKPPPIASSSSLITSPPVIEPDAPMSTMRKGGFVLGGIGLALVGVGAIAGGVAISKNTEAAKYCPKDLCNTPDEVDRANQALTFAHLSTATFAVGIAGVVAGTVMVVMAPKTAPGKVSLSIGPQFISVTGKF